jgi:hypothetical protein
MVMVVMMVNKVQTVHLDLLLDTVADMVVGDVPL